MTSLSPTTKAEEADIASEQDDVIPIKARKEKSQNIEYDEWGDINLESDVDVLFDDIMIKSQGILRSFLQSIGRFPLMMIKENGRVTDFIFSWTSLQTIYFAVTTFIIFYILVMGFIINVYLMGFDLELDDMDEKYGHRVTHIFRTRETALLHRGFLIFVVVGMNIFNAAICSVIAILRRQEFANYFVSWTRCLQTMQLDVSPGLIWNTRKVLVVICLLSLVVIPAVFLRLASFTNGSLLMSVLCLRLFSPLMLLPDNSNSFGPGFYVYQILGVVMVVMSILWGKSFMILYYIKAKTLINAITRWNARAYSAVLISDKHSKFKTTEGRTTYELLFKDHCLLLDLIEGTNNLFEGIIESYFGTHTISMAVEALFFFTVMRYGHRLDNASEHHQNEAGEIVHHGQFFVRPYDVFSVIVIFILNQTFYLMVLLTSSDVRDELMVGMEIARRTSMIGRKTDEELFFLLSLFNSFNGYEQTQMEGGRFFSINKELFVDITTLVIYCCVIGLMFKPLFDWPKDRQIVGPFISALEGLPPCHWQAQQDDWATCKF